MTEKIINTPGGPIKMIVTQKYSLSGLLELSIDQLAPFFSLFRITEHNNIGLSNLIRIMKDNNILLDEDILDHPYIWDWISTPTDVIERIMTEKGIWFPGMSKYLAIKVLLQSHTIVSQTITTNEDTTNEDTTNEDTTNEDTTNENEIDKRLHITTGVHYEKLPDRDFGIYQKRSSLKSFLLHNYFNNKNNTNIEDFNNNVLRFMYEYYDKNSFNMELSSMIQQKNRNITFSHSIQSLKKVGEHSYDPSSKSHQIRISSYAITKLFTKGENTIKSNGLIMYDRVDALINIFEHEITHLYCSLKGYTRKIKQGEGKMYYSSHGKLFQELVFRYFGHTDFRHDFNHGDTSDHMSKDECRVDMDIYFETKMNEKIYGKIIKINPKTCSVVTENNKSYKVPYVMIRPSDKTLHINIVEVDNNKNKYNVGMSVSFKTKTGYEKGKITKCNPKRAKVTTVNGTYNVPYDLLLIN